MKLKPTENQLENKAIIPEDQKSSSYEVNFFMYATEQIEMKYGTEMAHLKIGVMVDIYSESSRYSLKLIEKTGTYYFALGEEGKEFSFNDNNDLERNQLEEQINKLNEMKYSNLTPGIEQEANKFLNFDKNELIEKITYAYYNHEPKPETGIVKIKLDKILDLF